MRYRSYRRKFQETCRRCGAPSHPDFAPECSSECVEWVVDARHLSQDEWDEIERDRGF